MNGLTGVLDSGVGGLSVLSELVSLMPKRNFIYFGDTKNMPYGTKTPEEIYLFTKKILEFFFEKNVKNVVFACNTTSAVAYDRLKEEFSGKLSIFPLIQTAAAISVENLKKDDTVAVFATRATIKSKKYEQEIHKIMPEIKVLGIDCTGFVEIVENRTYNDSKSIELIDKKLEIAKQEGAKRIILGCTHYPYLINIFKNILPDIEYFNPANALAKAVCASVAQDNAADAGNIEFFVSKNPEEFKKSAETFFNIKDKVNLANL